MSQIIVIGSVSIDNVTYTKTLPQPGTTIIGEQFLSNIGGKGANQACACSFLKGDVYFLGAVGKDEYGERIIAFLKKQNLKGEIKKSNAPTGIASITLETTSGENRIVIVPGANMDLTKQDILVIKEEMRHAKYLLIQLENPLETVYFALKTAKELGLTTILNPAPYREINEDIFPFIDYFVPNEHELAGYVKNDEFNDVQKAEFLHQKGLKNVIVTLGEKGSVLVNDKGVFHVEAKKVKAVDTTAAGDSYLGAFVTALSKGKDVLEAMEFASLCSGLTVTKKGAIASLPKLEDLPR